MFVIFVYFPFVDIVACDAFTRRDRILSSANTAIKKSSKVSFRFSFPYIFVTNFVSVTRNFWL